MYTLKLDLSQDEHDALLVLLRADMRRSEREGTTKSPFATAVRKIHSDITGYDEAVADVKGTSRRES